MRIIEPSFEIMTPIDGKAVMEHLEQCGRICYKSEPKDTANFISAIIMRGHESVLEHFSFTVKFIVDRGVSHELVRHRLASFSQESTRYCNYAKERFNSEITVVKPCFFKEGTYAYDKWKETCLLAENAYFELMNEGYMPQEARSVLLNSLKTEVMVTANLREWRHILKLRTAPAAHPQMREVMVPLLIELKNILPVVFYDIGVLRHRCDEE